MTILCVDDSDLSVQHLKKTVLRVAPNAQVHAFVNPKEALKFAKTTPIDVALLEIDLPTLNGLILAQKLKDLYPMLNIIFVTVCSEHDYARELIQMRISGYLFKLDATEDNIKKELENLRYPIS